MENVERLQEAEIRKFDWVFPFDLSITFTAGQAITPFILLVEKNTFCLEYKYKYENLYKEYKIQEYNVWSVHHTHSRPDHYTFHAISWKKYFLLRIKMEIQTNK